MNKTINELAASVVEKCLKLADNALDEDAMPVSDVKLLVDTAAVILSLQLQEDAQIRSVSAGRFGRIFE